MVPQEWPIAVDPADLTVDFALARSSHRLDTVRRDFFLDPAERLSEQERALMTAMLHDLIASLAKSIRAAVDDNSPSPDPARIAATLGQARLLDRPNLVSLMLRRADEQRLLTIFAGHAGPRRLPLLPTLVADPDPQVAAAAMALIVARGRRRDGFGQARIELADLAIEDIRAVAQAVAVALSPGPGMDDSYATAASSVIESIDTARSLDQAVEALVDALVRSGRADDTLVETASGSGDVALVASLIARRARMPATAVWDHLVNGGAGRLALIARMAGFGRPTAARLIADVGSSGTGSSIEDEMARFDVLDSIEVARALRHWQLPDDYRAAVDALGGDRG